jgi:predicted HicB family RNase H-like nuclease
MEVPSDGEVWAQLATRIPKTLHRQMKLHCVRTEQSVMDFVTKALQERLERERDAQPETPQLKVVSKGRH